MHLKNIEQRTQWVKTAARALGFNFCGISKAEFLEEEAPLLEKWLEKGMQGEMGYMNNHFDMRLDPRLLVPGAKSVISLLLNYFPEEMQRIDAPKVSKYAYGTDYHLVIKEKCKSLMEKIGGEVGEVAGRCFVDSAPVLDKVWAKRGGLGWVGKNSNLINPKGGSFFFIAEIILDVEFQYDGPIRDYCGTCTRCIDACPTQAIVEPYVVDGSKCISYLTIELKSELPVSYQNKMDDWIFGCDVCQDVCPWNRFSKPQEESAFENKNGMLEWNEKEWMEITEDVFSSLFAGSAIKRAGFKGISRNLKFIEDGKR